MTVLNKYKSGIPAGAVYIGRGSKWGNRFVIGRDGDRDEVCDKYASDMEARIARGEVSLEELAALDGRDKVCFCAPHRCHGDYLEQKAAWAAEQLRERDLLPSISERI